MGKSRARVTWEGRGRDFRMRVVRDGGVDLRRAAPVVGRDGAGIHATPSGTGSRGLCLPAVVGMALLALCVAACLLLLMKFAY